MLQQGTNDPQAIMKLQTFLKANGLYNGAIDGKFGPITANAVKQFQTTQGIKSDAIVGPITQGKINSYGVLNHPAVAAAMASDPAYAAAMKALQSDPKLSDAANAAFKMVGEGTYSPEEFRNQYAQQYAALDPYYRQDEAHSKSNIENQLGLNKENYNRSVADTTAQFGNDKQALDTDSANKGILFSTARMQNEAGLQNKYQSDLAGKSSSYNAGQSGLLNDYQYKYGDSVNSLGQYMNNQSAPTLNASTPQNNVQKGGIQSIYNPGANKYYGTQNTAQNYNTGVNTSDWLKNYYNKSNQASSTTKI